MNRSTNHPSHVVRASTLRRLGARAALVTCVLVAAPTTAAAAAPLAAATSPSITTEVRPLTTQFGDSENNFTIFLNKSRAELCTPEQFAFERVLLEWLNSDRQTAPPPEPDASRQGVEPVRITTLKIGQSTTLKFDGRNLPVEVWRIEDDEDGLACGGTDGAGAGLFGTGTMTLRALNIDSPRLLFDDFSVEGRITDPDGQRYTYLVRYEFRRFLGHETFTPTIRLEPIG